MIDGHVSPIVHEKIGPKGYVIKDKTSSALSNSSRILSKQLRFLPPIFEGPAQSASNFPIDVPITRRIAMTIFGRSKSILNLCFLSF